MTHSAIRTVSTGVDEMQRYSGKPGLVIAMDGPAGSGKSSAARRVAAELGLRYLDTGAMYRALTWWLQAQRVDLGDIQAVLGRLAEPRITIGTDPLAPQVMVDGQDVAGPIRTREVSNAVSSVAVIPQVRQRLISQQRDIIAAAAQASGIVAEGRDVGTVVAPDAQVKLYLTASAEIRARRRSADLRADPAATVATTRTEQARRDRRDAGQLAMADDAIELDTSSLGLDEVVARVVEIARTRQAVSHG